MPVTVPTTLSDAEDIGRKLSKMCLE